MIHVYCIRTISNDIGSQWRYFGRIIFPKQNQTASAQLLTGQKELAISLEINPQPLFGGVGVLSILKLAGALH